MSPTATRVHQTEPYGNIGSRCAGLSLSLLAARQTFLDATQPTVSVRPKQHLTAREQVELHQPRKTRRRSGRQRSRDRSLWAWDDDKSPRPIIWTPEQLTALRVYWSKFIKANGPWEWFVTLTFKQDVSLGYALRSARGYLARLRQAAKTRAEHQVSFGWVMAVEPTTADRWHLHLLVKASGALVTLSRFRWECRWKGARGKSGIAKILPAEKPAAPYLCKYTTKGGQLNAGGDVYRWQDRGPFGKSEAQPDHAG